MTCPFYHKLCGTCKKWVCRGYFPEKQPHIAENMVKICLGDDYEKECLIYLDAVQWREERKKKSLNEHCPLAHNAVCGKPWIWICKYAADYFFLTEVETDEHGRTVKDGDGNLVFKPNRSIEDIKEACLSGDTAIYEGCPHYKEDIEYREHIKRVKKEENP